MAEREGLFGFRLGGNLTPSGPPLEAAFSPASPKLCFADTSESNLGGGSCYLPLGIKKKGA